MEPYDEIESIRNLCGMSKSELARILAAAVVEVQDDWSENAEKKAFERIRKQIYRKTDSVNYELYLKMLFETPQIAGKVGSIPHQIDSDLPDSLVSKLQQVSESLGELIRLEREIKD